MCIWSPPAKERNALSVTDYGEASKQIKTPPRSWLEASLRGRELIQARPPVLLAIYPGADEVKSTEAGLGKRENGAAPTGAVGTAHPGRPGGRPPLGPCSAPARPPLAEALGRRRLSAESYGFRRCWKSEFV